VALTPTQERTLEQLRRSGDPVVFDAGLIGELQTEVRAAVDEFAERLDPGDELFVSKYRIGSVLECEDHHLAEDEFDWSPAKAKGKVSHRAIQLMVSWKGEATPTDLVDEAIARLAEEDRSVGPWIAAIDPADHADLRGQTVDHVTQFMEGFPPLRKEWHPVTETRIRWPNDGPIILSGQVDLTFGRPSGTESRKVIIDLKTGRANARHRQDLGFYALVETLRTGVPPRKVATYYLDAADAHAEDVTESLLHSAVRRTLDGINALIEVEIEKRTPIRRPGNPCRWCPLSSGCAEGQAWLTGTDEP
jgi:hypothetical protein